MIAETSSPFLDEIRETATRLESAGFPAASLELRNALYGATGGEIYGALASSLKQLLDNPLLPPSLLPEIRHEISVIDAAYDRVGQPRPFAQKVENR